MFIYFLRRYLQGPGSRFSIRQVEEWAKRPFKGEELFMVGSAYHPYRAYSEGALMSANNALLEGWGIPIPSPPQNARVAKAVNHGQGTKLRVIR